MPFQVRFQRIAEQVNIVHRGFFLKSVVTFHETFFLALFSTFVLYLGDRYVRESPSFYNEGTFSIYQFRQTLQQTSQGYDCANMLEAEPAIRQLLKLDFEPKVSATIRRNFRQTINQTIKTHTNSRN